jgi:hypothetical protein
MSFKFTHNHIIHDRNRGLALLNYYNYPHTNLALPARYGGASHYPHDTFIYLYYVDFLSSARCLRESLAAINAHWDLRASLVVLDVWVYIDTSGFLEDRDIVCDNPLVDPNVFARGAKTGPLWLTRPWQPSRGRLWGFGVASVKRSCTHDTPNPSVGLYQKCHLFLQ